MGDRLPLRLPEAVTRCSGGLVHVQGPAGLSDAPCFAGGGSPGGILCSGTERPNVLGNEIQTWVGTGAASGLVVWREQHDRARLLPVTHRLWDLARDPVAALPLLEGLQGAVGNVVSEPQYQARWSPRLSFPQYLPEIGMSCLTEPSRQRAAKYCYVLMGKMRKDILLQGVQDNRSHFPSEGVRSRLNPVSSGHEAGLPSAAAPGGYLGDSE